MAPQKLVLDTNVVISSLWGGNPRRILDLWQEGRYKVLVSLAILQEYQKVLERFEINEDDKEAFFTLFLSPKLSVLVEPKKHTNLITTDPADNILLDCALEGGADCIVSGDNHLLRLKTFEGISILSPKEFL